MSVSARNEPLKLEASAINPINGGPMRNPINPSDETAVMAIPAVMVFDLPAAL
jgi:hypothetical protein